MKRALFAGLVLSVAAASPAFAGGIGHSGSYNDYSWAGTSTQSRADVRADLNAAYRDGTLPALNKTTYPSQGLVGSTQAERLAVQENHREQRLARAE
jgi:hypothetical protein